MFRLSFIVLIIFLLSLNAIAQPRAVSLEELGGLQARQSRPVFILLTTDWCKYCYAMKNMLLKQKAVSQLMEKKFYLVILNAEEKKDIVFAGKLFRNRTGIHELASELGTVNGQIAYPSFCILNEKNEIIYQHEGYIRPEDLMLISKL